jgi:predicted Fe-S protein YdhL (DUF1289 family)
MKQAGWTENDLRAFTIKHYHKSHWNLLDPKERRAVIAMFQSYIRKQKINTNIENPREDTHE